MHCNQRVAPARCNERKAHAARKIQHSENKYINKIILKNTNQKKGVLSHKADFRPKKVTGHGKEHYILIDMSMHQDEECYGFKYKDMRIDLDYNTGNLGLQFSVCFSKIQCSHLKKYRNNNGHALGCSNV